MVDGGASCYQAMVDAAAEKGWETVYTDNVATSDYATVMTDYAELGYDLIFAPGNPVYRCSKAGGRGIPGD